MIRFAWGPALGITIARAEFFAIVDRFHNVVKEKAAESTRRLGWPPKAG
jgi:hypothetical protein